MERKIVVEEGGAGDQGKPDVLDKYLTQTPGQDKSPLFSLIQRLMKEKKEKDEKDS